MMNTITNNMRNLSYGLYAIGAMDGERPCGCIVNSVFQVTSQEPIVALSMNYDNYTYELIKKAGRFSVSILSESSPKEVIQKLGFVSGRDHDKYEGVDFEIKSGLPVLNEKCSGSFLCEVVSAAETSTHCVFLAKVVEGFEGSACKPMTYRYYHEVIKGGAPKNAPSYVEPKEEKKAASSEKWVCDVCGYVYEGNLEEEPDSFVCPICGVDKTHFVKEETNMTEKWVCDICGYIYEGDLTQEPDDYVCPICGVGKDQFSKVEE